MTTDATPPDAAPTPPPADRRLKGVTVRTTLRVRPGEHRLLTALRTELGGTTNDTVRWALHVAFAHRHDATCRQRSGPCYRASMAVLGHLPVAVTAPGDGGDGHAVTPQEQGDDA